MHPRMIPGCPDPVVLTSLAHLPTQPYRFSAYHEHQTIQHCTGSKYGALVPSLVYSKAELQTMDFTAFFPQFVTTLGEEVNQSWPNIATIFTAPGPF